MKAFWRGFRRGYVYGTVFVLGALLAMPVLSFLLARPVVAAAVFATVLVGLYGWCYREQLR